MANRHELTGKVVLITGAGRGVGAATARLLDSLGCRLALADLDTEAVAAVAGGLRTASAHRLDISDPVAFKAVISEVEARYGRIDVLVNNAGIMPIAHFTDESVKLTQRVVSVNLLGTIYGTRLAHQAMRRSGSGHVINVASIAGKLPAAGLATYSASKFGVVGYTDAVRAEAHGSGVRFSTILPGVISTELSGGMHADGLAKAVTAEQVAAVIADVIRRPRRTAYVPGKLALLPALWAVVPPALVDWALRKTGADRAALDAIGSPERASYEARLTHDATQPQSGVR